MSSYDPFLDHDDANAIEVKKRKKEETQDSKRKRTLSLKTMFMSHDDGEDYKDEQSSSIAKGEKINAEEETITEEQKTVITKTAIFVSQNQNSLSHLMEKSKGAKNMAFLFDPLCAGGKFYQSEMSRLRAEKDIREAFEEKVSAAATLNLPIQLSSSSSKIVFPAPLNSNENNQWEQKCREQRELQVIESRIREALKANTINTGGRHFDTSVAAEEQLYEERLREYKELAARYDEKSVRDTVSDAEANGGVIEGGTWEHRKRAKEMLETAAKNLALTVSSAGRHHLGDFLPKTELEKFMSRVESGSSSSSQAHLQPAASGDQLSSSNVGFQLLQKVGWSEGSGLGARSGSLVEPLRAVGQRPTESKGLGLDAATSEPQKGDDEFEQYRKRMQLAYRFRPNPLNNPRRNYY